MSTIKKLFILVTLTLLTACAHINKASVSPLASPSWQLTKLMDFNLADHAKHPTITFNPRTHRVSGTSGCNRFMGSYKRDGHQLTFSQMGSTMMACAQGMKLESHYLKMLEKTVYWQVHRQQLVLLDADHNPLATFTSDNK